MAGVVQFVLVTAVIAAAFGSCIALAVLAIRWARKGSTGASFIGWALMFLGVGMNPQPPPQEQVEEVRNRREAKKDADSGDPERL